MLSARESFPGGPARARTEDRRIKSPLLCHLSYGPAEKPTSLAPVAPQPGTGLKATGYG